MSQRYLLSARKKNPFTVIEMSNKDFYPTKKLENVVTNRKTGEDGINVEWMKMQWLRFTYGTNHHFFQVY